MLVNNETAYSLFQIEGLRILLQLFPLFLKRKYIIML